MKDVFSFQCTYNAKLETEWMLGLQYNIMQKTESLFRMSLYPSMAANFSYLF